MCMLLRSGKTVNLKAKSQTAMEIPQLAWNREKQIRGALSDQPEALIKGGKATDASTA